MGTPRTTSIELLHWDTDGTPNETQALLRRSPFLSYTERSLTMGSANPIDEQASQEIEEKQKEMLAFFGKSFATW